MAVAKRIVFVKAWTTAVQLALESKSPPAGRTLFHFELAVGGHLGAARLRPVLPALGQEDRLAARLSNRRQREHATPVVGAVLWQRTLDSALEGTPIMPDGCLDLLWDGNRLFVAGPDTAARWHRSPPGTTYVALRFSGGLGPTLLGVPADELQDRSPNLEQL